MDSVFRIEGKRLIRRYDAEQLWVEPWGANSLRVRATELDAMQEEDWALLSQEAGNVQISVVGQTACIQNGSICAEISSEGKLTFLNRDGKILLQEYVRMRTDIQEYKSALNIEGREFKPILGGDYSLAVRFESDPEEKLFGMGQYQQPFLDLKNCTLELAQRNSQASVPFALSSLGYGFLWNNPAVGQVTFGKNITEWVVGYTKQMDYWITAGDSPAQIVEEYARVTGTVPMMPAYAMGLWQSKLRYQTQKELLAVAREYKRLGIPISVIVADFFHWTKMGEWKFDPVYWPDPAAMVSELKEIGIELMVSIWPTVDKKSENYPEMLQKGFLVRTDRGIRITMEFVADTVFYDTTNPGARDYVWEKVKQNYYDIGIRIFWLDLAEPEYSVYDFDNYRYFIGPNVQIGNIYPVMYAKGFYEGMTEAGQKNIINLLRCAWAGSQRYGALVWSGDIDASFRSLRIQIRAGLNMGLAGIPWWTTDIGGFHGGNPNDPFFREVIIRWFQYATFCPVMRMHGDREPHTPPLGVSGGGLMDSGAPNEVWSYGAEAFEIFKKFIFIRERLRPYITELMIAAHEKGTPPMRPLFYDFPQDREAWNIEDEFMFGPDLLVAPVLYEGARARRVYLPKGSSWKEVSSGIKHQGGMWIASDAPLEDIPLFLIDGAYLPI
ncbi:glycoside hydrolase family 31 protein [Paenibacillus sedimenti]|uniref:Glycoside hydrolase family 31 protein n=1 Tax=Paenibacillus sedimenti TaxID=2770274 RepID=A0A926KVD8_9BACL|nr:glycoside hydrolase family 31 protein [Paenibacillus sedimenti]MBD0384902.1 glycoside hydrolase family 31 protein [Paenibacillus sedimenti]